MKYKLPWRSRVIQDGECLIWQGAKAAHGYGVWYDPKRKRMEMAHRRVYELEVGPIPNGMEIDHRCGRHDCVNPAHLEPVIRADNVQRGSGAHHGTDHINKIQWVD